MTTPSPFEIGQAVGSNVSGAFRGARDKSAIDEILEHANSSEDPQAINNAMSMILQQVSPERQQVAMQILQQKQQQLAQQRQANAYREQGLSPDLPESINKELIKNKQKGSGASSALDTLKRMREIQSTGHLGGKVQFVGTGRKFGSTFNEEGQRLRAEYERLGKSLIQSATNIPIRNKQEFETLAAGLYDTDKSNEQILGTIDAMERIIRQSLGESSAQQSPQNSQFVRIKDPSGVIRNIPADKVQAAQQAGGELVQ